MFHKWAAELTPLTCALPTAAVCNTKPSVCRCGPVNCSLATQNVEKGARGFVPSGESVRHERKRKKVARPAPPAEDKSCHL